MRNSEIKRSKAYHSMDPIGHVDHMLAAKNDVVGSIVIMALMLVCLSVMRILLTRS
jgi:hypothetical protein